MSTPSQTPSGQQPRTPSGPQSRAPLRAAGAVLAGAVLLALAWASTAPLRGARTGDALMRLSWGARPERIETCRTQTDEELAKVNPQMRQRVVCEGTTARYQLEVRRDGSPIASGMVRGGGLRHDRELYVFREIRVPAGRSTLSVRFVRVDSVPEGPKARERPDSGDTLRGVIAPERAQRETDERRRRREEAVPPMLTLDTTVTLAAHEVLLVTYDPEERRLRMVRRAPRPGG